MKELSEKYKNSIINKSSIMLASCVKIELKDGTKVGFTTNTEDVIFKEEPDLVYKINSFTPSAFSQTSDMSVGNLDTDVLYINNVFNGLDLERGKFNGAKFYYFNFNFGFEEYSYADIEKINFGVLGEVKKIKGVYTFELRDSLQYLQAKVGKVLKATCGHNLYDENCKVSKANNTFSDRVDVVSNLYSFTCQNLLNANDDFKYGLLTFTSGEAKNVTVEVKSWTLESKRIDLQLPLNFKIKNGDEFTVYRGCDKREETCKSKFKNFLNFGGFPFTPGMDALTSGV